MKTFKDITPQQINALNQAWFVKFLNQDDSTFKILINDFGEVITTGAEAMSFCRERFNDRAFGIAPLDQALMDNEVRNNL
jgi:hypothetical protein